MAVILYRCPYCPLIHLHEADHTRHMADHANPVWVAEQAEWLSVARENVAALNLKRIDERRKNDGNE
jgi:hypothetical protein